MPSSKPRDFLVGVCRIPAVAWFPDFQHRRLPQLFPAAARWQREVGFRVQIASGRTIMLSSESSLRDFRKFYPGAKLIEVCVVRFATQPSPDLLTANPSESSRTTDCPSKYFYLPNQFYAPQEPSGGGGCAGNPGAARSRCCRVRLGQHRRSTRARLFRQSHGAGRAVVASKSTSVIWE